jgi:hypothetical protein
MLIEVANSGIECMEPRDLTVPEAIRAIQAGQHWTNRGYFYEDEPCGTTVLFADGRVLFLFPNARADVLDKLLTFDGQQTVTKEDLERLQDYYYKSPEPRFHWGHIWTEILALLVLAASYAALLFRPRRRTSSAPAKENTFSQERPAAE